MPMRPIVACVATSALISLAGGAMSARAQQAVPPLIGQTNNGNWLSQAEVESLRDELYYQHAVHAY